MALKTNFTDDILAESMNGKRQYNVTENSNGTKSLEDVTDYQSIGSTFSAKDMNETNAAVNQAYDDMGDEFNKNTKYLAGAVKIHNNKLWKFKVDHDPGEWDESQVRKTTLLDEIGELTENSNWKQLLLAENIPATFTQYDVKWNECKELIFVLGFYGNVLETIVEPVSLFATHNGEGNRIIFGASDEVEIYASLPTSNDSMFIKNGGRSTNVLRIYGR
jgi:hypothetical protein